MVQGGHWVDPDIARRRYEAGWANFNMLYRDLADSWAVYDNSGDVPVLLEQSDEE